jgi:hypothetical protein
VLRLQQVVAEAAERFLSGVAIELLRAAIPVDDRPRKLPDKDGVVRLLQKVRLSSDGFLGSLALGDVVVRLQQCGGLALVVSL